MRNFIRKFLYVLLFFQVLAIFALCFAPVHWLAELVSHFMLQHALVAAFIFTGLCAVRASRWSVLLSLVLGIFFSLNVACLLLTKQVYHNEIYEDITLLQFNINYSNPKADALAGWINNYSTIAGDVNKLMRQEKPDIIVLQEVSPAIAQKLKVSQKDYPYQFVNPKDGAFGSAIYSRIPLRSAARTKFEESFNEYSQMQFHTLAQGITFTMVELHTVPPVGEQNAAQRNNELRQVTVVMNQQTTAAKMLVGDLNTAPYSPYLWRFERSSRLVNSMQGRSLEGTWPSFLPVTLRIPIDHVYVSDTIEVLDRRVEESQGSDHLPVLTKLRIYATSPYGN